MRLGIHGGCQRDPTAGKCSPFEQGCGTSSGRLAVRSTLRLAGETTNAGCWTCPTLPSNCTKRQRTRRNPTSGPPDEKTAKRSQCRPCTSCLAELSVSSSALSPVHRWRHARRQRQKVDRRVPCTGSICAGQRGAPRHAATTMPAFSACEVLAVVTLTCTHMELFLLFLL